MATSQHNPAGLLTREVNPDKLILNELWWSGPLLLMEKDHPYRGIPAAVNAKVFSKEHKKL